ncbi:MAG: Rho termination factor N-terminal domain-containing protein, partial [Phycisphaerales bacterium]|nr:Rho termination factor N-terminal domain-containing protein [Phycisphaerales bacterium]
MAKTTDVVAEEAQDQDTKPKRKTRRRKAEASDEGVASSTRATSDAAPKEAPAKAAPAEAKSSESKSVEPKSNEPKSSEPSDGESRGERSGGRHDSRHEDDDDRGDRRDGRDGQSSRRRKRKKRKGPPQQMSRQSSIPDHVLPSDEELEREAAELEKIAAKADPSTLENQLTIGQLQRMEMDDLFEVAEREGLEDFHQLPKQELIFKVLKAR